jgi:chromosome partitioning protein
LSLSYLGVEPGDQRISDILVEDGFLEEAIAPTKYPNLFAIPADHGLKVIKSGQAQMEGGELRLRTCLRKSNPLAANGSPLNSFDWIIIDCPPSLDKLTMNALVAADFALIPVDPGAGGRTALADTIDYIGAAQKWYNPTLRILGMLINNVNTNTVYDQTTESAVRSRYGEQVFETVIPSSVRIRESAEFQTPMIFCVGNEYRRYAQVYRELCREVLKRAGVKDGQA